MNGFSGESEFEVFWVEKTLIIVVEGLGGIRAGKVAIRQEKERDRTDESSGVDVEGRHGGAAKQEGDEMAEEWSCDGRTG